MLAGTAAAEPLRADDRTICQTAISDAARDTGLPSPLLHAIGLAESGRIDPGTGRAQPWPWTINIGGIGQFFATKGDAVAAVRAALASGVQSIDVGCMQVNLFYHPTAFASLEQAFDPQRNTVYAAGFLRRLFGQFGDWSRAAAAYHSQTPGVGEPYARRVAALLPEHAAVAQPRAYDPLSAFTPAFRAELERQAEADRRQ